MGTIFMACCQEQNLQLQINQRRLNHNNINPPVIEQPSPIPINKNKAQNYQFIQYLGEGAFGKSAKVEQKLTKHLYVMKNIQKGKLQKGTVLQSSLIETISKNTFFVAIKQTFQPEAANSIYIIMEYFKRGQLFFYLKKNTFEFTQKLIMEILSQVIVAIQILHSHKIIYRQLKPQNILITNDGHIKLNDFCLSKIIDTKPMKFIGIQEYMAPEALSEKYDTKFDCWSIGILMFQLKFGKIPFIMTSKESKNLKQRIQNLKDFFDKLKIQEILNRNKSQVSQQFFNLLSNLLVKNPQKRFSLQQIKNHSFFKSIDWQVIKLRKNKVPACLENQSSVYRFKDPNHQKQKASRKYINTNQQPTDIKLYQFLRGDISQIQI